MGERLVRHRVWFEVGAEVVNRERPKHVGIVEAIWTDHKLSQEFAQVLWEDGSRDILPTDRLDAYVDYSQARWSPEPSPRKEYMIRRRVDNNEIDLVSLRAILESQGLSDSDIARQVRELSKAEIFETVEGWKIFEVGDRRYILKGKQLIQE